jgi:hypothetical protein
MCTLVLGFILTAYMREAVSQFDVLFTTKFSVATLTVLQESEVLQQHRPDSIPGNVFAGVLVRGIVPTGILKPS